MRTSSSFGTLVAHPTCLDGSRLSEHPGCFEQPGCSYPSIQVGLNTSRAVRVSYHILQPIGIREWLLTSREGHASLIFTEVAERIHLIFRGFPIPSSLGLRLPFDTPFGVSVLLVFLNEVD